MYTRPPQISKMKSFTGGNKRSNGLKQTCSSKLQVCLSTYEHLLLPCIKGLRFRNEILNKWVMCRFKIVPFFMLGVIIVWFHRHYAITYDGCINCQCRIVFTSSPHNSCFTYIHVTFGFFSFPYKQYQVNRHWCYHCKKK